VNDAIVAAAFDQFDAATIASFTPYVRAYVAGLGIEVEDLVALGRRPGADADESFRPAYLAVRGSATVNGVSRLHGTVSRRLFASLFPRWPEAEVPVGHVTNGVHVPSWDSPNVDALWERACGKDRWRGDLESATGAMRGVDDRLLWEVRGKDRQRLVHVVRTRLARQLGFRGADQEAMARAAHAFDPDTLTLGFARRFAAYKRPALLLRDADRLERLLTRPDRPVQIVIAGKAHPDDREGAALITAWIEFASRPAVRDRVAFLEDYDITLAEELVRGVDVWVNTPRPPWEACGTSGMKVLANGGLNVSTPDGWWAEAYDESVGWCIGRAGDSVVQTDAADAAALYELLERKIVPEFYCRDAAGVPTRWLERVRASMAELAPRFSANRMVREYVRDEYIAAAELLHLREDETGRVGKELCAWHTRITRDWRSLHFGDVAVDATDGRRAVSVPVYLGALHPSDVAVELYADAVGAAPSARLTMADVGSLPGSANGRLYRAQVSGDRPLSDYTPRVVPAHPGIRVPIEAWPIVWSR
jgi:glycogen phosphorylase